MLALDVMLNVGVLGGLVVAAVLVAIAWRIVARGLLIRLGDDDDA